MEPALQNVTLEGATFMRAFQGYEYWVHRVHALESETKEGRFCLHLPM